MPPRTAYGFILGAAILWCGMILLAPALATWEGTPRTVSAVLYRFFTPICHQMDGRSFHLFGFPLAVCSRCSSIYFAFLAGTLVYPFLRGLRRPAMPSRAVLFVAVLPMVLDAGASFLGFYEATFLSRTLTGVFFGLLIPFFIIPAAIEGAGQLFSSQLQKGTSDA